MKILRVEQFSVADDSLKKIEMPTPTELDLASLNVEGNPLLQYWFEFSEKLQNSDGSKIRNRSSSDVFDALDLSGKHERSFDVNGVMTTQFRSYANMPFDSDEYTLFAVFKISDSIGAGANTSIIGQQKHDDGSVNGPILNITEGGNVRVFKTGNTTVLVNHTIPDIKSKLQLVSITQSAVNGTKMRVNKSQVSENTYPTARAPCTVKEFKILGGSITISANFNGSVGAVIICPKDLTDSIELNMIEDYLFEKYCE